MRHVVATTNAHATMAEIKLFMVLVSILLANACDQQIAAKGLSTPLDAIAILLHRLVRHA